jgi:hypothetical protein
MANEPVLAGIVARNVDSNLLTRMSYNRLATTRLGEQDQPTLHRAVKISQILSITSDGWRLTSVGTFVEVDLRTHSRYA